MNEKFFYANEDSSELFKETDEKILNFVNEISNGGDFEIGFHKKGYKIIFLLTKENKDDIFKDEWKVVFYEEIPVSNNKTLTIDNIGDTIIEDELKFEAIKELECNYADVVQTIVDISNKHKEDK